MNEPARCVHCGACVAACYAEARELVGRQMSIAELLDTITRDRPFYERSQGGVTISGGEPLHQPEALLALLQACKAHAINTAVDTCGYASWPALNRILPYTDLFLYDLKHLDDDRHCALTGVSNQRILANLQRLAKSGAAIWVRMPLIPGINDGVPHLHRVRDFIATLPGVHRLDVLPYHPIAQEKYRRLNLDYTLADLAPPSDEHVQNAADILRTAGLTVTLGG